MIILTIRTDKSEAEIGLFDSRRELARYEWTAHRQLAETLHTVIKQQLAAQGLDLHDLEGVAVYAGPGSFTGLRIGITVANTLAYALTIPIVATSGADWQAVALERLASGQNDTMVVPEYGADVHITQQKK